MSVIAMALTPSALVRKQFEFKNVPGRHAVNMSHSETATLAYSFSLRIVRVSPVRSLVAPLKSDTEQTNRPSLKIKN